MLMFSHSGYTSANTRSNSAVPCAAAIRSSSGSHRRTVLPNRIRQRPRTPQKNPAVPRVVPGRDKLLRLRLVRLLGKPLHPPHRQSRPCRPAAPPPPQLDVPVARLRPRRRNAQHHDLLATRRQLHARRESPRRTAPRSPPHGPTERSRSPSPAPSSPAETPPAHMPAPYSAPPARSKYCSADTSGSCSAIVSASSSFVITQTSLAAATRQQPIQRLLDHRALAIERQHLLRPRLPAPRPEPRSAAARKNHRRKPRPRLLPSSES